MAKELRSDLGSEILLANEGMIAVIISKKFLDDKVEFWAYLDVLGGKNALYYLVEHYHCPSKNNTYAWHVDPDLMPESAEREYERP
jgi:hypothetical protein